MPRGRHRAALSSPSRLWRLRFTEIGSPAMGGTLDMARVRLVLPSAFLLDSPHAEHK